MKLFNEEFVLQKERILLYMAVLTSLGALMSFLLHVVFFTSDFFKPFLVLFVFATMSFWLFYFLHYWLQKMNLKPKLLGTLAINIIFLLVALYNPLDFSYMWVYLLYFPIILGLIENENNYLLWSILYIAFYSIYIFMEGRQEPPSFLGFQVFMAVVSVIFGYVLVRHLESIRNTKVTEKDHQIKVHIFDVLSTLVPVVELKTQTTKDEITEMSTLMRKMAKKIPNHEIKDWEIELLSLLHYVSKIQLPDYLFEKHDKLTSYEYKVVQNHCLFGYKLLGEFKLFENVKDAFLKHHKRLDGSGYPHELDKQKVPKLAQILGVVECYLAMVSPRSYREAIPVEQALLEILESEHSKIEPAILDALADVILGEQYQKISRTEAKLELKYVNAI